MLPELSSIKRLRRALGLTQFELARLSGVSQSLVAKVESGAVDPSYSSARRVFELLEQLQKKGEKKAGDVMSQKVSHVYVSDPLSKAINLMRKLGISQMPVLDEKHSLAGSISEKSVLERLEKPEQLDTRRTLVSDLLEEPFPSVRENTPVSAVSLLLHDASAVLVVQGSKLKGIITKADLLKAL